VTSHQLIDLGIVALYLLGITAYGMYAARGAGKSTESYFLGGRDLGWFVIGASIFATNISTTQFMSGSGLAHRIGLAAINNDLIGGLLLGLSAVLMVPMYIKSRLFTVPEFLERRYNRTARLLFSWTYVLQNVLSTPTGFYIGGLAVLGLFGFDPQYLTVTCIIVGATVGTYSVLGGLTSVAKADAIQVVLLIGGGLLVAFFGVQKVGGLGSLYAEVGATHFELLLPRGTDMPWTALPGIALHSCYFAFASVHIVQKVLAAKDQYHAQTGMLFAAWLKFLAIPLFAIPGIVAMKLYPDAVGDATYSYLVRDLLPVGVSGLVMAGLLAALMSTADSGVVALSSVVALDIYPSMSKQRNDQTAVKLGRWVAGSVMAFGVLAAPYAANLGPIYPFILRLSGFAFMPVGVCFVFGRFSRRVNHQGALACLATGVVLGFTYVIFTSLPALKPLLPGWLAALHFYEILPAFFTLLTATLFIVSWLTPPPSLEKLDVLSSKNAPALSGNENRPVLQSFQLWFALFLGTLGLIYIVF
jgi:solute:Na+ symporter, SSS family